MLDAGEYKQECGGLGVCNDSDSEVWRARRGGSVCSTTKPGIGKDLSVFGQPNEKSAEPK